MLSTAIALSILTLAGCLLIYGKLPRRIRKLVEKHSLLTDLLSLIGIYFLLGGTLTALLAASMCGVVISILLHIANHEEDFLYLYDARDMLREKLTQAKVALNAYGKDYRERKMNSEMPSQ